MISSSTIHIANALTIEVSGLSLLTALKQTPSMSRPTSTETSTETHRASRSDSYICRLTQAPAYTPIVSVGP